MKNLECRESAYCINIAVFGGKYCLNAEAIKLIFGIQRLDSLKNA